MSVNRNVTVPVGSAFIARDASREGWEAPPPAPLGLGSLQRLDDHVRDALRHLVGEKEDVSRDRDDSNTGTRLEYRPLVLGQPTIALLGVQHPRRWACFAEPPRGIVVPVEPTQVRLKPPADVAGVVPREVRPQLRLTFARYGGMLQHGLGALPENGERQRPEDRAEADD